MKQLIYILSAFAVAALSSCTTDSIAEYPVQDKVPVTINVGTPATKRMGSSANDMQLKNFQIFVFTSTGKFETASELKASVTQVTLDLLPGPKHIWVLGKTQIEVSLKHIACKIVLDKVTRSFANEDYGACPLIIKSVYISNVAADTSLDGTAAPTVWCNKFGDIDNNLTALQKEMLVNDEINYSIAQSGSYDAVHTFYAYPNPTVADNFSNTWSARHTRLVIKCDYNGKTCYYPVTLPKSTGGTPGTLERNKVYHISQLTIKRPGSSSPENPGDEVDSEVSVTFKVTVSDWEGDTSYTEIFE